MGLGIEVLSSFDEDETGREIDSPSESRSRNHDLHLVLHEELLA